MDLACTRINSVKEWSDVVGRYKDEGRTLIVCCIFDYLPDRLGNGGLGRRSIDSGSGSFFDITISIHINGYGFLVVRHGTIAVADDDNWACWVLSSGIGRELNGQPRTEVLYWLLDAGISRGAETAKNEGVQECFHQLHAWWLAFS